MMMMLVLMLLLMLQIYLRAKSCNRVMTAALESRLQLSPELFRLQGWWFRGWGYRVPARRSRNCKSAGTKCNSSCTWKIQITLGCSPHVTTGCDGWGRHTVWRQVWQSLVMLAFVDHQWWWWWWIDDVDLRPMCRPCRQQRQKITRPRAVGPVNWQAQA